MTIEEKRNIGASEAWRRMGYANNEQSEAFKLGFMMGSDWQRNIIWHDAIKDPPFYLRKILINHDGEVHYGVFLGNVRHLYGLEIGRYVYEQISIDDDMATSYVMMGNFKDGDKWAYMEDFF